MSVLRALRLRTLGVLLVALATVWVGASAARADLNPNPPTAPQPSGGSQSGSSGGAQQGKAGGCSLYATSSSFGLSCLHGSGDAKTVGEILHGDPADFCWDVKISDADLETKYQYQPNPDSPYYLHSCVTGLDLKKSQYDQPGVVLSPQVLEISDTATDCKRPYKPVMTGTCLMHLTKNQQIVVGTLESTGGQIPDVILTTHPSTRVRTNEDVAYTDRADNGSTRTANYQVGGVTMWATMDKFLIEPYGPDGSVRETCDGTANVSDTDTRQTQPNACWWTYDSSSAEQPNQVYPFRAEADWTVYVRSGNTTQQFASFAKYTDLQLPVFDIQSIVVP